jgi:hypothetical protein
MHTEFEYVSAGERLPWALGCLAAAINERFKLMQTGTLRISRVVLSIELLVCFLPLSVGWLDGVVGGSGLVRFNAAIIEKYFLDRPQDVIILSMMIAVAIVGLVGPIGLFLASRAVLTGVALRSRALGRTMIIGILGYAIASLALLFLRGPGAYAATTSSVVLFLLLPMIGVVHLMYLGSPTPTLTGDARPASG